MSQTLLIKCLKCGSKFNQAPADHLRGRGCRTCANLRMRHNTSDFIVKATKVHGNKYDYSAVKYKTGVQKVTIICRKHGRFRQRPKDHILNRQGCPKCHYSKAELRIDRMLQSYNVEYTSQSRIGCKNPLTGRELIFDFYIPSLATCIEFDGPHHFAPIRPKVSLNGIQYRDKIKTQYCQANGIRLERIKFGANLRSEIERILKPV